MATKDLGGYAAAVCGATYVVGFAVLATVLAPMGYGTTGIDADAVVAFIHANPSVILSFNTIIYVVNALALAVLVMAMRTRLAAQGSTVADLTMALGLLWAALVLGAGMIGNVAAEQAAHLFVTDPAAAAERWHVLHSVELGLGGGNEIAGGAWILLVSVAAWQTRALPGMTYALGVLVGLAGLTTIVPAIGDVTGAVFGLGAIAWFFAVAWALLTTPLMSRPGLA